MGGDWVDERHAAPAAAAVAFITRLGRALLDAGASTVRIAIITSVKNSANQPSNHGDDVAAAVPSWMQNTPVIIGLRTCRYGPRTTSLIGEPIASVPSPTRSNRTTVHTSSPRDDAELRVELVASHLMGLAFARYQLRIEPIASTGVDELVAWVGPTVQRYLTGPTPEPEG